MSTQITVTLADEVYDRARNLAQLAGRPVPDLLADTIALSLPSVRPQPGMMRTPSEMSNEEVLRLSESLMPERQSQRLSVLLDKQQAGALADDEQALLSALMQTYQEGLVRKAQALHESVRRGLREPLEP